MAEEITSNSSSVKVDLPEQLLTAPRAASEGSSGVFAPTDQTVISRRPPIEPADPPRLLTRTADIGSALEGKQLGLFRLDEFVGGGGMGAVFRGVDTSLDRIVAVKVVSNDQTDEDTLRRFRNEAQSAARLDHPNIARVYSVGDDGGWNFIVFEFIEGVNVRDLVLHKGPLPIDEAISYVIQAADALQHASERNVVHRDIKPSNLLVMEDGRAKLVDMGLARLHQVGAAEDITATGQTLGTFDYISPEQARDPRDTDVRSDLYSLGCTLYYMLTGMPPFPEGTAMQKLISHSADAPPDPRDMRADVPEEVANICLKLMAKQPSQRYQQPSDLIDSLSQACEALGLMTPRASTIVRRRHSVWTDRVVPHVPWAVPFVLLFAIVFGVEGLLPKSIQRSREQLEPPFATTVEANGGIATEATPPADDTGDNVPEATTVESDAEAVEVFEPREQVAESETEATVSPDLQPFEETDATTGFSSTEAGIGFSSTEAVLDLTPKSLDLVLDEQGASSTGTETREPNSEEPDDVATHDPTRLIVMPDVPPSPSLNPMIAASLEEALRRLPDHPEATVIELRFDSQRTRPLTINLRRDLRIEAGAGYRPVLTLDAEPAGDKRMLHLLGGKLTIDGVHFEVDVPLVSEGGWTLFHLNEIKQITLIGCSLTMRNDYRADASFFQVQGPSMSDPSAAGEDVPVLSRPNITLTRCIARGEANFVRATDGLPFYLVYTDGFVVTTERLVELGQVAQDVKSDLATVKLQRVTAMMEQGMCLVKLRGSSSQVPELYIEAQYCLLRHGDAVPLIEHVGVGSIDIRDSGVLTLAGKENGYPGTRIAWRIQPRSSDAISIEWNDRRNEAWFEQGGSEAVARWAGDPPKDTQRPHEVPLSDYYLDDERGFSRDLEDILTAPTLPDESPVEATSLD